MTLFLNERTAGPRAVPQAGPGQGPGLAHCTGLSIGRALCAGQTLATLRPELRPWGEVEEGASCRGRSCWHVVSVQT